MQTVTNTQALRRGFTMVEILVVITGISILAAVTVMAYQGFQERTHDTRNLAQAKSFINAVENITVNTVGGALPTVANLNDSSWRTTNSFQSGILYDSYGKAFAGIGSSDVSEYVQVLIPDYVSDSRDPCAAMVQVRKKQTGDVENFYINMCPASTSNFSNFPTTGCPTSFAYYDASGSASGSVAINADSVTGFCELAS